MKIYAFTLFASHDHSLNDFKPKTKSHFYRDLGARTAEAVKKYVPSFGTGSVFEFVQGSEAYSVYSQVVIQCGEGRCTYSGSKFATNSITFFLKLLGSIAGYLIKFGSI